MKKIIIVLLLLILVSGCAEKSKSNTTVIVINSITEQEYKFQNVKRIKWYDSIFYVITESGDTCFDKRFHSMESFNGNHPSN